MRPQLAAAVVGTVWYMSASTCMASYFASTHSPDVIGGYSGSSRSTTHERQSPEENILVRSAASTVLEHLLWQQ